MKREISLPEDLVSETSDLVCSFAEALGDKLYKAQVKYGYTDDWVTEEWADEARKELYRHIDKGDPLDVANYCAFLWFMGEPTCLEGETKQVKLNDLKVQLVSSIKEQDKIISDNKRYIESYKEHWK